MNVLPLCRKRKEPLVQLVRILILDLAVLRRRSLETYDDEREATGDEELELVGGGEDERFEEGGAGDEVAEVGLEAVDALCTTGEGERRSMRRKREGPT